MRVLTQNVQCKPELPSIHVEDIMRRALSVAKNVMWQEIEIDRYRQILTELHSNTYFGNTRECGSAISWNNDLWHCLEQDTFFLHKGLAGVCDDRYGVEIILRRRNVKTAKLIRLISVHFVPGAWGPQVFRQEERRVIWNKGMKVLRDRMWNTPTPIIVGGDFNRHGNYGVGGLGPMNTAIHLVAQPGLYRTIKKIEAFPVAQEYGDHSGRAAVISLVKKG